MTTKPEQPWELPLFAAHVPVEVALTLARAFVASAAEPERGAEQAQLDHAVACMLACDLFRRGADYREVPWSLRLLHVSITGQAEGERPRRPDPPASDISSDQ